MMHIYRYPVQIRSFDPSSLKPRALSPPNMELTLAAADTTLFTISKTLNPHRRFSAATGQTFRSQLALLYTRRLTTTSGAVFRSSLGAKTPLFGLRNVGAAVHPVWCRLECVSSSAASFASHSGGGGVDGGGNGGSGGGGGGGGGAADGGEVKASPITGGVDDVSVLSSDVIILDVGGMTCGGCAASVKRILENQPKVSSASVNLTTETAIVWPVSEAKVTPNWQKVVGEELAKHLTTCGFKSNLRGDTATDGEPS